MSGTITRIINKVLEDDVLPSDNNQHWPVNTRKQSQSALGRLVTTSPPKRFKKQSIVLSSNLSTMQGIDSPYIYSDSPPWYTNSNSNNPSPLKQGKQASSLTQSPIKKRHQQEEARITINTIMTNTGGMVVEDVQVLPPPVIEKKRGSLSLEGSSIDIAPSQKEISQMSRNTRANAQESPRNSFENYTTETSMANSQYTRSNNSSIIFSPTKKDTISNIVQSQDSPVKKITYDIVMPSMSFYQIENKEAFNQHYRSVSPTPSSTKSAQVRPPKYEAHLQSMDLPLKGNDSRNNQNMNNSLEIEKANIRSVNNSIVMSSVSNSQVISTPSNHPNHPQTRLPNIHQKKDVVFDKHNNTLSLALDNHHRPINNTILNTNFDNHIPKPNSTPTISCTALSGFIFSKVHGVQNISPNLYSKRYNPTTHAQTAKKSYFHGNAKKPYNGLVEISSFAKTRKKPHVDPDVIVR